MNKLETMLANLKANSNHLKVKVKEFIQQKTNHTRGR